MRALTLPRLGARADARAWTTALRHPALGLALVLAAFAATAAVVPVMTPVATTDDWGYTRSVEILVHDGHVTIFPVVAATAVFQVGWGALFASIFGMSLGIVRVSSVVMSGIGAAALFGLLGELGVPAGRRILGTAVYLFNPLAFMLAYTFMTDAHFTALLLGATWLTVRGVRLDRDRWLLAGSVVAGCAFLTRQQGALIPFALGIWLLASRQVWFDRAGVRRALAVAGMPAAALVGYYLWLLKFNDVPAVQQGFADEAREAGAAGAFLLARNLVFIALVYLGFFLFPLALAALPALRGLTAGLRARGWAIWVVWAAILDAGFTAYLLADKWMPYIGQFVGIGGMGPPDVLGSRARLLGRDDRIAITVVCGLAAMVVAFALAYGLQPGRGWFRGPAGALVAVTLGQALGVLPPSFHYLHRGYSLDRYLLPLLPLGVALVLWSTRDLRLWLVPGWLAVGALALVSVVGTRDYLTYLDTVWRVASNANAMGVSNEHLDAGAAWDGYHLYTLGLDQGITRARSRNGPWWVYFYGKATDSRVVVAGRPMPGYIMLAKQSYDPWWGPEDTIYLLAKPGYRITWTWSPATERARV